MKDCLIYSCTYLFISLCEKRKEENGSKLVFFAPVSALFSVFMQPTQQQNSGQYELQEVFGYTGAVINVCLSVYSCC